jgi:hypothetical protein
MARKFHKPTGWDSVTNPPLPMNDDAMAMGLIPSLYGHPLVSAIIIVIVVIVIKGMAIARVAKARVAIAICRITAAKEGEKAKAQVKVAMVVVVMVRFGPRGHGNHASPKSCSGNK